MADGSRTGPARVPHDMGGKRIEHLGRSTASDGAARIDDIQPPGSVESLDGSILVTNEGGGLQDLSVVARPAPSLTKRYYLTGVASDISGDYLFSTTQPAAADLQPPAGSTYPIIVDSPVGEPGLATWPAGIVMAHIVARVLNAHLDAHMLYPMSFGTGDESAAMLARGSYPYQVAPWPATVYLTGDYQTFTVPLYVQSLGGSAGDRLRAWLRCNPQGGTITDEQFEIHLGDSYFDTLFTPSSGGATVHNDLTGRGYDPDDTTDCHPMRAITPGFLHTPTTSLTSAGGLLDISQATSNSIELHGAEPLVGILKTGLSEGDDIELFIMEVVSDPDPMKQIRTIANQGSPGNSDYGAINLGTMGLGSPPQNLAMTLYSCLRLGLHGGAWRPVAPWFICEAT